MHLDALRRQWAGDEALGVQHLQRSAKCLPPELDVSALLSTIFLLVNVIPFPGLKTLLATFMRGFIPSNDLPCHCQR